VEVHFSCMSLPRVMPYGNSTIDSNSRITSEAQALNTLVVGLNSPSWCGSERRRTPKNRGGLSIYNAPEPICDWTSSSDLVRPLLPKAIGFKTAAARGQFWDKDCHKCRPRKDIRRTCSSRGHTSCMIDRLLRILPRVVGRSK
jgi:hypothetical protein